MTKLSAQLVYELKALINGIPKESLGVVDNSAFKAITMRRKLSQMFTEKNKAYEEKIEQIAAAIRKSQEELRAFESEIDSLPEAERNVEAKAKETLEYKKDVDDKLVEALKAIGEVTFYQKEKGAPVLARLVDLTPVEFELTESQKTFLQDKVERYGAEKLVSDEDVCLVGEALGMQSE